LKKDQAIEEQKSHLLLHRAEQALEMRKNTEEELRKLRAELEEQVARRTEQLQKSEEHFRLVYSTSPDAININRLSDGLYVDINDGFTRLTGFTREDVIGRPSLYIGIWRHPEDRQKLLAGLKDNGHYENLEAEFRRKDGSIVTGLMSAKIIFLQNEPHLLSITRDISDRKRAEEEKAKLQLQLVQAQKMESIGRLAGGVAHDFNNMLGVIIGHLEMAMDQVHPSNPLYADLETIRKAADRSAELTRQLLAFARKQTVSPRVQDLNQTVSGMLKMLRRIIGEDIQLIWKPGADLWPVKIDPSQIDQILANLSVNARDAIDGVGKLIIETKNIRIDESTAAGPGDVIPGDYILLCVNDSGCGMSADVQNKIFEPFFTTKSVGQGTGLGLAMIYGIVKQNSGFIYVESKPDKGTTFRIYLPRYTGIIEETKEGEDREKISGGTETVLVVEDEPAMLNLCRLILEKQGYRVLASAIPAEAIELAGKYEGEIHLLIVDVMMPEMNGRDLSQKIAFLHPDYQCLFMSGYTADVMTRKGLLAEGVHFIQKPFTQKAFTAKVREILDLKKKNP
jgi:PAS domain S-box-containing protein